MEPKMTPEEATTWLENHTGEIAARILMGDHDAQQIGTACVLYNQHRNADAEAVFVAAIEEYRRVHGS